MTAKEDPFDLAAVLVKKLLEQKSIESDKRIKSCAHTFVLAEEGPGYEKYNCINCSACKLVNWDENESENNRDDEDDDL